MPHLAARAAGVPFAFAGLALPVPRPGLAGCRPTAGADRAGFARVKGYREDKDAADADTIETVRTLYEAQAAQAAR